ncbi:MAG: SUMF1/EgtB/PvdO family nonheme iron enzyme [Okeania sp. SIO2F4]|uniref:SUMF1/EgtB/PvdO family nonheme iron enzyme n=1 Tax=Okeania sp. SIO2F4 TaxID=2607790 RepID=UPI00142D037F|nr:SUMF1/EgtB/PvdO family nonheme iron enzyme [Okeania sp. SIO2F4]NES06093.1 SUMF1/EgtB/PvdO family nonheme iron enzyme [Okeania sp. SIO2F4]
MNNFFGNMINIPERYFLMGADETKEEQAEYEEEPERKVWLSEYSIQIHPVTVAEWYEFLTDTKYDWGYQKEISERSPYEAKKMSENNKTISK